MVLPPRQRSGLPAPRDPATGLAAGAAPRAIPTQPGPDEPRQAWSETENRYEPAHRSRGTTAAAGRTLTGRTPTGPPPRTRVMPAVGGPAAVGGAAAGAAAREAGQRPGVGNQIGRQGYDRRTGARPGTNTTGADRTGFDRRRPGAGAPAMLSPPPARPATPAQQTDRRRKRRLRLARIAIAVASALVLLATAFVTMIANGTGQQEAGLTSACPTPSGCTGTTILLVGSDARVDAEGNPLTAEELAAVATQEDGGGLSTDTMMLIHIPAGGGKATAVSIPRDSWIADSPLGPSSTDDTQVPYAPNKVNSYYGSAKFFTQERLASAGGADKALIERESSNAGRKMLIGVLESLTGVHIDHYAEVNLFGFYLLSNAIGGVPVCLKSAVDDPLSGAKFAAGPQEVSGTAALSFVRQRHGLPGGDLDRVRRQQAFLSGAISKVLSVGTLANPAKLSALVDAANRSIVLSNGFNLLDLSEQIGSMSSGNINFETIPTHGAETTTTKDALHIDVTEIRSLFSQIVSSTSTTAATADSSGAPATAADGSSPATSAGSPAATGSVGAGSAVDPASITVDVQNATMTNGMAAAVRTQAGDAGYTVGEATDFPGTKPGNELSKTNIRYTTGELALAQQVKASLGFGELTLDRSVTPGHVLIVVGLDRIGGGQQGLRAGQVATSSAGTIAAATDATTINAAQPGCVN